MDTSKSIQTQEGGTLEARVTRLESHVKELMTFCTTIGNQNSALKTICNTLEIEIKILKQGGNI